MCHPVGKQVMAIFHQFW